MSSTAERIARENIAAAVDRSRRVRRRWLRQSATGAVDRETHARLADVVLDLTLAIESYYGGAPPVELPDTPPLVEYVAEQVHVADVIGEDTRPETLAETIADLVAAVEELGLIDDVGEVKA